MQLKINEIMQQLKKFNEKPNTLDVSFNRFIKKSIS